MRRRKIEIKKWNMFQNRAFFKEIYWEEERRMEGRRKEADVKKKKGSECEEEKKCRVCTTKGANGRVSSGAGEIFEWKNRRM